MPLLRKKAGYRLPVRYRLSKNGRRRRRLSVRSWWNCTTYVKNDVSKSYLSFAHRLSVNLPATPPCPCPDPPPDSAGPIQQALCVSGRRKPSRKGPGRCVGMARYFVLTPGVSPVRDARTGKVVAERDIHGPDIAIALHGAAYFAGGTAVLPAEDQGCEVLRPVCFSPRPHERLGFVGCLRYYYKVVIHMSRKL